jgi:hypothetical protein
MVKKDLERIGIPYETPEGIADVHASGTAFVYYRTTAKRCFRC